MCKPACRSGRLGFFGWIDALDFSMGISQRRTVGVLALQGDFEEHLVVFRRLGVRAVEVRTASELFECDGLVIPGGESTVMSLMLDRTGLRQKIVSFWKEKKGAIWGLCAGAIMLSRQPRVESLEKGSMGSVHPLGLMDMVVDRNAYGRQTESFAAKMVSEVVPDMEGVFIRAPRIVDVGKRGKVLATFKGDPVLVRQGRLLACTFHPELTEDARLHEYFLGMV